MKIKVLGGSVPEGNWKYVKANKSLFRGSFTSNETVNLKDNIKSLTVLDKENIKSFIGSAGWGFIGTYAGAVINPVGAIAGLGAGIASGGKKSELTVAIELSDDSKFLAVLSTKLYREFESLTYKSSKSSLVEKRSLFATPYLDQTGVEQEKVKIEWFEKRSSLEKKIITAGSAIVLVALFL